MFRKFLFRASIFLFGAGAALAQQQPPQQQEWTMHKTADGLHPSAVEQQMVWFMNRARANPTAEGLFLSATGDDTTQFGLLYFGVDVARLLLEFTLIKPAPPAAFDRRLYEASRLHSNYMISVNNQVHDGQADRLNQSGFGWAAARLSIYAYGESGIQTHAALNIDYGGPASEGGMQAGRGHRAAIMSSVSPVANLSNVGFAMVPENNPVTDVGPYVFSGAYASAADGAQDAWNRFVVGTVWTDLNHNGRYDEGEGLNGVKVELNRGNWYAVTGIAGGYAIPVAAAGNYSLSFSGGAFPGKHYRNLTIGDQSVLADAETTTLPASAPPPVAQAAPMDSTLGLDSKGALTLSWSGGIAPYQVQVSHQLSGAWQNLGAPTQEHSMTVPITNPSGFFRVLDSE